MDNGKKTLRRIELEYTTLPIFGVVVFFDIWRNETSGERRLEEIGRTCVLDSFSALNVYAETHNPASQLLKFRSPEEYEEVSEELAADILDPEFLFQLFQQI